VVLGDDRSPHETTFQIAGTGHRIKVEALRQAMRAEPAIRDRFLLFAQAFVVQAAQTARKRPGCLPCRGVTTVS
jgi:hypothetical protein